MAEQEIRVPDIGDFDVVDVIDVLVKPGDVVALEDPLITLESDKATMDVPASAAGEVTEVHVKVGDQIGEGGLIVTLAAADDASEGSAGAENEADDDAPEAEAAAASDDDESRPRRGDDAAASKSAASTEDKDKNENKANAPDKNDKKAQSADEEPKEYEVRVPDIGDFDEVDVIEILVAVGDTIEAEAPLITLESDKATMDVPAPAAGEVLRIETEVGAKVGEGDLIVVLAVAGAPAAADETDKPARAEQASSTRESAQAEPPATTSTETSAAKDDEQTPPASTPPSSKAHASPGVRKFARELGVDLGQVAGTGNKGRIQKSDVQAHVKKTLRGQGTAGGGLALPAAPSIDFSKFGETETTPLSKIRRLTGQNLHRSWLTAPHVFQMDEADITDLETFRRARVDEAADKGTKLTLLAFLIKAVVSALKTYPDFNASLAADGESLIHKKYFHIGVAVNTDHGLVVPVIRDADGKGLYELAREIRELSTKARERKISPAEMQGACFTISSLGGIGGSHFTPIINVPEVAILGVSPSRMQPVWQDDAFVPRLILPFTLAYDHRVIDGVAGARFTSFLSRILGDIRHILL